MRPRRTLARGRRTGIGLVDVRVMTLTALADDLRAAEHTAIRPALEQPVATDGPIVLARARVVVELNPQEHLCMRNPRHALERPAVPHDAAVTPARAWQVYAVSHLQHACSRFPNRRDVLVLRQFRTKSENGEYTVLYCTAIFYFDIVKY